MTPEQQEAVRRLVGHVVRYRAAQVQQETLELLEYMSKEITTITGERFTDVEILVCDAALKAAREGAS